MDFMKVLEDAESLLLETPAVLLPRDHEAMSVLAAVMLYKNQRVLQASESVYAVYLTDTELVFYTYRNDSTFGPNRQFTEVSALRTEIEALSSQIVASCVARDSLCAAEKNHT